MLPAALGKLFVSVTVTAGPSVTINVGPGTCIGLQNPDRDKAGTYAGVKPLAQPYPHE